MRAPLTPGVTFERRRQPPPLPRQRTDVAGFVGLAERGPLHAPQRLTSWRDYQQVFGGFLAFSHLAYAVRAFFENGGRVCWVVRIADARAARPATAAVPAAPPEPNAASEPGHAPGHTPAQEAPGSGFAYSVEAASPGAWGTTLEVSLEPAHLAATEGVALPPAPDRPGTQRLLVASTAGLYAGSRVRLRATGPNRQQPHLARVQAVDAQRGIVELEPPIEPLPGSDPEQRLSLESVEFSLLVWHGGQVLERFEALAPDSEHQRDAVSVVNARSRQVRLARAVGEPLPTLPWRGALSGGADGLRSLTLDDHLGTPGGRRGLATLAAIEEVGLLAMPDLLSLTVVPPASQRRPRRRPDPCRPDAPPRRITLSGRVLDDHTRAPLEGVAVDDGFEPEAGGPDGWEGVTTDRDGRFRLAGQPPGGLELTLRSSGYLERAVPLTLGAVLEHDLGELTLQPLELPPELHPDDVQRAQAAMIAQCTERRDRFALLDPPLDPAGQMLGAAGLQTYRARFDTPYAALYYPWLQVPDQSGAGSRRWMPPSGHVAGVYAATDLTEGVHRPPANRALAFADDVGALVDDAGQALLNPLGINVIRAFPGRGIRLYGARTLSSDSAWRFVNVRRLMSSLEAALREGLQWAVFEPNDAQLQLALRSTIASLLDELWRRGAFAGRTREAAYAVRCDHATTPPEVEAAGRIVAEVRVAPTVPYEFIVLRLGLSGDELRISEV